MANLSPESGVLYEMLTAETHEEYERLFLDYKNKEIASRSSRTKPTSSLRQDRAVASASAPTASSTTCSAASLRDLSIVVSTDESSPKCAATKDYLSPGARRIDDLIVSGSATTSSSPTSVPAAPRASSGAVNFLTGGAISAATSSAASIRAATSTRAPAVAPPDSTSASVMSSSTATRVALAKHGLSPEAQRIYDYIVGNSDYLFGDLDSFTGGSTTPSSAASKDSTVLPNPMMLNIAPIASDVKAADLAVMLPTTCSSECPNQDAAVPVSVIISPATTTSSTTTCGIFLETNAPAGSGKAHYVDVRGDTARIAAVCFSAGPDHIFRGEDYVSTYLTLWSVPTSFNAPPLNFPSLSHKQFPWLSTACSTECSGCNTETPSRLQAESYKVFNAVTAIVPWPPPSCSTRPPLLQGYDLFCYAQQKRGKKFLTVSFPQSPFLSPIGTSELMSNVRSASENLHISAPPGNLPTTVLAKFMGSSVCDLLEDGNNLTLQSPWPPPRYEIRCKDMIQALQLNVFVLNRVQPMLWVVCTLWPPFPNRSTCIPTILQWDDHSKPFRYHWVAFHPNPLWKLPASYRHENLDDYAGSFILHWDNFYDENRMHVFTAFETCCCKLCSIGETGDCLQYEYLQLWRPPDQTAEYLGVQLQWESRNMGIITSIKESVPAQLLEVYNMLCRLTINHFLGEIFVTGHWLILWEPGDESLGQCVIFLQPTPPWSYLPPAIATGAVEYLHIVGTSLEFNQFMVTSGQGSRTYGCFEHPFILLLGLYCSCHQYVPQNAPYFGIEDTQECLPFLQTKLPWQVATIIATPWFMSNTKTVPEPLHTIDISFEMGMSGLAAVYVFCARFKLPEAHFLLVGMSSWKYPLPSAVHDQLNLRCLSLELPWDPGACSYSAQYQGNLESLYDVCSCTPHAPCQVLCDPGGIHSVSTLCHDHCLLCNGGSSNLVQGAQAGKRGLHFAEAIPWPDIPLLMCQVELQSFQFCGVNFLQLHLVVPREETIMCVLGKKNWDSSSVPANEVNGSGGSLCFARSNDLLHTNLDSWTYENCFGELKKYWDPGGVELQFFVMLWDPGGSAWCRLEGKPNLKEEGLSATTLLDWLAGLYSWAVACSRARRGDREAYIPGRKLRGTSAWNRTDWTAASAEAWLGQCCVWRLYLLLPPSILILPTIFL